MGAMLWLYTGAYLAGLCGLLLVTRHKGKYYAQAKGALSLLFVLGACLAFWLGGRHSLWDFANLLAALVLCALGDVLLGVANKAKKVRAKPFLAGTISFGFAHVLFCVLFYRQAGFFWYDFILSAVLMCIVFALEKADRVRLKKMRIPGYIYTFMIGLMTTKAVQTALWHGASGAHSAVLALGSVLFLISDIVLLFLYFGTHRRKSYRYANLSTYYVGVYMMALGAYWM